MHIDAAARAYSRPTLPPSRVGSRRRALVSLLAFVGVAAAAPTVSAQMIITPFIGYDTAPATLCQQATPCADSRSATKGIAYGRMGRFFGQEQEIGSAPGGAGAGSRGFVAMTNFMLVAKAGRFHPYIGVGPGLMYVGNTAGDEGAIDALSSFSNLSFGYHTGGGLMVFLYKGFGIRADIRQFRSLGSLTDVTGGVETGIDDGGSANASASAPGSRGTGFRRVTASAVLRF